MQYADLYIRVSTDEQAEKGYSLRDQEDRLRKYCELKNITVRDVITEDYSAKTFDRPAWRLYLAGLKKSRDTGLVLFTKWDRFSRNAGDAYQMISTLRKLGMDPQAVEQPLDLSVPENKMMLAFYLAAPEIENDRRALNTMQGMRRARKEGRYMGKPPVGYINRVREDGVKYISLKEPEATIMRWAFNQIATSTYSIQQIYEACRKKGLKCQKANFWVAIRNPMYYGKIQIKKYKDEPEHLVEGLHEPLITESLFNQVQNVLDGKKKQNKAKIFGNDIFPLRGFLQCAQCGKMFTASSSKGRNRYYNYYHCYGSCRCRFEADVVHQVFVEGLKRFTPRPGIGELFRLIVSEGFESRNSELNKEKQKLELMISETRDRIAKARELLLTGVIEPGDYKDMKRDNDMRLANMTEKLSTMSVQKFDINAIANNAVIMLGDIPDLFTNGDMSVRHKIIGSMFPDKLLFDGHELRTARVNEAAELVYTMGAALEDPQKKDKPQIYGLSNQVSPNVRFSNQFLIDLQSLAKLAG